MEQIRKYLVPLSGICTLLLAVLGVMLNDDFVKQHTQLVSILLGINGAALLLDKILKILKSTGPVIIIFFALAATSLAAPPTLEVKVPEKLLPGTVSFVDVETDAQDDRISVIVAPDPTGSTRFFKRDRVLVMSLPQGSYTVVATVSNEEAQITKVSKITLGNPAPIVPDQPQDSLTVLIRSSLASVNDPDKSRIAYQIGQTFLNNASIVDPQEMIDATMQANQSITAKEEWQNKVFTPLERYLDALMVREPATNLQAVWVKIGKEFQANAS